MGWLKWKWGSREKVSVRFLTLGTKILVISHCEKNRIDFREPEILRNLFGTF